MSRRRIKRRRRAERRKRWIRYGLLAVVAVIGGAAWLVSRPPAVPPVSQDRIEQEHFFGPAEAAVTIIEYEDYNCPSCRAYHQAGILERVQAEFPSEVRIVFRHFPIITAASPTLAQAAECAADQDQFWVFQNELSQRAPLRSRQAAQVASSLGLDQPQFEDCLDSRKHSQLVEAQTREAYNWGLRGTPSFVVNGQPLAGPPNFDQLEQIVLSELSNNR